MARNFTEREKQIIRLLNGHVPLSVVAELLDTSVPTLNYARKQLGISVCRGTAPKSVFVWKLDAETWRVLTEEEQRTMRLIRRRELNERCIKLSSREFSETDFLPVEAVQACHGTVPNFILRQVLGLSEKTFVSLCRALGLRQDSGTGARLEGEVYRGRGYPDLSGLSSAQQAIARELIDDTRKRLKEKEKQKQRRYALNLLQQMKKHKKEQCKVFPDIELRSCRTNRCRSQWPADKTFFYSTTDSEDGLQVDCKYCTLLLVRKQTKARRGRTKKTRDRMVHAVESEHLIEVLRELHGEVPVGYIRSLYNLSPRQFTRLRKLAGLTGDIGESHRLLHRWRSDTGNDIPRRFNSLNEFEHRTLVEIWHKDRKEWRAELAANDAMLLQIMDEKQAKIARLKPEIVAKGLKSCHGGCAQRRWQTQFFFPIPAGRYKNYCRLCYNRTQRLIQASC